MFSKECQNKVTSFAHPIIFQKFTIVNFQTQLVISKFILTFSVQHRTQSSQEWWPGQQESSEALQTTSTSFCGVMLTCCGSSSWVSHSWMRMAKHLLVTPHGSLTSNLTYRKYCSLQLKQLKYDNRHTWLTRFGFSCFCVVSRACLQY